MRKLFIGIVSIALWLTPYSSHKIVFATSQNASANAVSIIGKVLRSETSEPVAGVEIGVVKMPDMKTISAGVQYREMISRGLTFEEATQVAGQGSPMPPGSLSATTDESGSFVLSNLPPGNYGVVAQRSGYYVSSRIGFPLTVAIAIATVQSGQTERVQLRLAPSAAIGGKVTDRNGKPVADAQLELYGSVSREIGLPTLRSVTTGSVGPKRSNDRGEYRLYEIPPGDYYLVAIPARVPISAPLFPTNNASSSAQVSVATYYPNDVDTTNAILIHLKGGEDLSGVDIRLAESRTGRVTGKVLNNLPPSSVVTPAPNIPGNQTGGIRPSVASITLTSREKSNLSIGSQGITVTANPNDGTFQIPNVPFGVYDLYARLPSSVGWSEAGPSSSVGPWAVGRTAIEVRNDRLENVVVTVRQGNEVKGRVFLDDRGAFADVEISLIPDDSVFRTGTLGNVYSQVSAFHPKIETDGAFVISAVPEARYRVQVRLPRTVGTANATLPPGTYLSDIRKGNDSVYDSGVEIGPATDDLLLEIRINTNGGSIGGSLHRPDGAPTPRVTVMLVPPIGQRQNNAQYKATASDEAGTFVFTGIAPGRYKLFAWDPVLNIANRDISVIESYEQQGQNVVIRAGIQLQVDMNLITEARPAKP
jgi:hypothetical protein